MCRPWELDDAMRRRLVKRIYIPLPDGDARRDMLCHALHGQPTSLSDADLARIVGRTDGCAIASWNNACMRACHPS